MLPITCDSLFSCRIPSGNQWLCSLTKLWRKMLVNCLNLFKFIWVTAKLRLEWHSIVLPWIYAILGIANQHYEMSCSFRSVGKQLKILEGMHCVHVSLQSLVVLMVPLIHLLCHRESLRRGWELMAICLAFFPPSPKFQSYLDGYMNRHRDPSFDFPEVGKWPIHVQISHYATVACKRLDRVGVSGKRSPRKPTVEEIDQARVCAQPFLLTSAICYVKAFIYVCFYALDANISSEHVWEHSARSSASAKRTIPTSKTTLGSDCSFWGGAAVTRSPYWGYIQVKLNVASFSVNFPQWFLLSDRIFIMFILCFSRVSADVDEVTALKSRLDHWELPQDASTDAHAPASLLKLWYRELYEPLIPDALYHECVNFHDQPEKAIAIVQRLPELNRLVLSYLIRFLQVCVDSLSPFSSPFKQYLFH